MNITEFVEDHNKLTIDYSNEALFNLTSLADYFNSFVAKFTDIFNSKTLIPVGFAFIELAYALRALNKHTSSDLEHFTVITPEYVSGPIVPYLTVLNEVIVSLTNIDSRLLHPLEQWAANMLTDPAYGEKIWISLPKADEKIAQYTDGLHGYFNDSVGDGVATIPFSKVYGTAKGLTEAGNIIVALNKIATKLLDGKLSAKADSVAKLIHRLTTDTKVANILNDIPPAKLKGVIDLTVQAARELELLAIVLFQVKTASYSFQETLIKINKQL